MIKNPLSLFLQPENPPFPPFFYLFWWNQWSTLISSGFFWDGSGAGENSVPTVGVWRLYLTKSVVWQGDWENAGPAQREEASRKSLQYHVLASHSSLTRSYLWLYQSSRKRGWIIRYLRFKTSCLRLLSCQVNQPGVPSTYPHADMFPQDGWCLLRCGRAHSLISLHSVTSPTPPANWVCQCSATQLSGARPCLSSLGREELA